MKKNIFLLLLLAFNAMLLYAQSEGSSARGSLNIVKEIKPPIFQVIGNVTFEDNSGDNAIDANEECFISMTVKNIGMGDGYSLTGVIKAEGSKQGITYSNQQLPVIKVGETKTIKFPISSNMNTVDGNVTFSVSIDEPNGFGTEVYPIAVTTRAFVAPLVKVTDYSVTGDNAGTLKKITPFDLQILVQNVQHGTADNVTVDVSHPDGLFLLNPETQHVSLNSMKAGNTQSIVYKFIVNNNYASTDIPIQIKVREKFGKYAENRTINLKLNQPMAPAKIDVKSDEVRYEDILIASLTSDVDKNIPQGAAPSDKRFAIIIGNEDYHSYQPGLSSESDVAFAVNDANIFRKYAASVLGVPEKNVAYLTNATAGQMNQQIERMVKLVKLEDNAQLFFYYAGHGFPQEDTKVPYIIPVDVSAANITNGINLYELYGKLAGTGARVTVFIDACFSGGGRDAGLLAARQVKLTPKKENLTGNLVIFSATQADQVALPYRDQSHGMFTYYLLKKLQQNPDCTYGELQQYITSEVAKQSLRENGQDQNPDVNVSPSALNAQWQTWKFIEK